MATSHGRKIQGRRALAVMAWVSLVIIAGLLWYGQEENIIRIQAWEPAALLLSAYSAFLAIFGWLLFAPGRKSAEESPGLFFSGMLTLIPPCFIAYHLMPPSSPLRGWLTVGVFVFGLFAILSPMPAEVFAVPRDRKSYLQPLTDSYLSIIDVEERQLDLQSLVPRSGYSLIKPDAARSPTTSRSTARDPWTDPFYGTGRTMREVGSARRSTYSESRDRTRESHRKRPVPPAREIRHTPDPGDPGPATSVPPMPVVPPVSMMPAIPPVPTLPPAPAITSDPTIPTNAVLSRPPLAVRSAFAPHESRAPNYQSQFTTLATNSPESGAAGTVPPTQTSASRTAIRRPLTEPVAQTAPPVGFQTPHVSRHIASSPPLVPSLAADTDLRELDRQIRELELNDERDADFAGDAVELSAMSPPAHPTPLSDVKMERVKDDHGGETIDGTIRVRFEVGQKRVHLHVPFSPPLPGLPEVECEAVGDDSIRCKVGVRQPYGIRIEARRSDASQSLQTEVGFAAVFTPSAPRA